MKKKKNRIRAKDLDAVHKIMPYLMPNRCEAEVYYVEEIDVTEVLKYLDKINAGKEKQEKMTLFHAIITATAQTIYNRPLLNRFVSGKRFYDRSEISFSFVAKNKLEDNAEERLITLTPTEEMTGRDISKKILTVVSKTRKENSNDMNDILNLVTIWPRFVTSLIMWCFRKLDFYGLVPAAVSDGDPNYSTVLLSNLGSVKANCCYHHLNNYGTNSIVVTVGVIHEEVRDGKKRQLVNLGLTLDERIADGIYFAKSVKLLKYILEHPDLLEEKVATKITIPETKGTAD